MLDPKNFLNFLKKNGINFFCGVPDSCVAPFVEKLRKNYVMANEGTAVAFGAGYYLSTKKIPLIYFQNSGLGNATDPLTNLFNKEIYGLPIVLLIGWRGHPKIKDEPQHIIQGKILKKTLKSFGIRHKELDGQKSLKSIKNLLDYSKKKSKIVAILAHKNSFLVDKKKKSNFNNYKIKRRDALSEILIKSSKKDKFFSSVGFNSREIFQNCLEKKISRKIFYLIGGMGHTAAVALGSNLYDKNVKNTICIDGDGSFIMHMGSIVNAGNLSKKNFKYVVFKNDKHESVGNINLKFDLDYKKFSQAAGFKKFIVTKRNNELSKHIKTLFGFKGSVFHLIYVKNETFKNLLRVNNIKKIKQNFLLK
jgi:phosphonopyruvate decarboxylase